MLTFPSTPRLYPVFVRIVRCVTLGAVLFCSLMSLNEWSYHLHCSDLSWNEFLDRTSRKATFVTPSSVSPLCQPGAMPIHQVNQSFDISITKAISHGNLYVLLPGEDSYRRVQVPSGESEWAHTRLKGTNVKVHAVCDVFPSIALVGALVATAVSLIYSTFRAQKRARTELG